MSLVRDAAEAWPVSSREPVYQADGPFGVRRDLVRSPQEGEEFGRLVVEHPGAVIVLALDEQDRALVLQQYRHPVGRRLVELPAGLLDVEGEEPQLTAERELLEEAGYRAENWQWLTSLYPSPGLSSEIHHFFLARDLVAVPDRGGYQPAHEEADLTVHWVSLPELEQGVLDGEIQDGPLAVALWAYQARLKV